MNITLFILWKVTRSDFLLRVYLVGWRMAVTKELMEDRTRRLRH